MVRIGRCLLLDGRAGERLGWVCCPGSHEDQKILENHVAFRPVAARAQVQQRQRKTRRSAFHFLGHFLGHGLPWFPSKAFLGEAWTGHHFLDRKVLERGLCGQMVWVLVVPVDAVDLRRMWVRVCRRSCFCEHGKVRQPFPRVSVSNMISYIYISM